MKAFWNAILAVVAVAGILLDTGAQAQVTTPGLPIAPLGYCQITSISAAKLLSSCSGGIPAGANAVVLEAEAQAIRYRDDGTAPTATVGMPIAVGGTIFYPGTLSTLRVIEQTSGAIVNVSFYRMP